MQDTQAFAPLYRPSAPSFTGTLVTSVTLASTDAAQATGRFPGVNANDKCQIQIANLSTSWAYVNFGVFGNITAATVATSYPVAPGAMVIVSLHPEVTGASVILGTGSATGNVIFTRGAGT